MPPKKSLICRDCTQVLFEESFKPGECISIFGPGLEGQLGSCGATEIEIDFYSSCNGTLLPEPSFLQYTSCKKYDEGVYYSVMCAQNTSSILTTSFLFLLISVFL